MITGDKPRQIAGYLPLAHGCEVYTWVLPKKVEAFWGHPWGWYTDDSSPFIEVIEGGRLIRTINALDVSEIEFMVDEE